LLDDARSEHGIPALAAAAFEGEDLIEFGVSGDRRLGANALIGPEDKFHLGSCTKAMTATLAALAIDDGVLTWDETVAELFPVTEVDTSYANATLAMLLSHQAGTWTSIEEHQEDLNDFPQDVSTVEQRAWVTARVLGMPAEREPGTAYAYSNVGYVIAGAALEGALGASWEELMTERLFEPLGMDSCGFGAPATPGELDQPWGHADVDGTLVPVDPTTENEENPAVLGPAGFVHCSLADWGKFVAVHTGATPLVSVDSLARLHEPWPDSYYALGWGVFEDPDVGEVLNHDGSNMLWYAMVLAVPSQGRFILAAANSASQATLTGVGSVVEVLAERYLGLRLTL
jgi:CubicO group peptidase (beta-lactamase class C family)